MKLLRRITLPLICVGFFFAFGAFSARTSPVETADLALINGRIWTGGDSASIVEAVAIRGNQIIRIGTTAEIRQLAGERTQLIDLGGRFAAPGFNDAHIHFLARSVGLERN